MIKRLPGGYCEEEFVFVIACFSRDGSLVFLVGEELFPLNRLGSLVSATCSY